MVRLRLSIIIPVYNHAEFLEKALSGLLSQEIYPDEIVVIDDASTDRSADIARQMSPAFIDKCRFQLVSNQLNLGVNATLNRGLGLVDGDYVACSAADDMLLPAFIREMRQALTRFPQARLITSQYVEHFSSNGRRIVHGRDSEYGPWYTDSSEPVFFSPEEVGRLLDFGHIGWPVNASVLHVNTLREIGGFLPELKWHADWFAACCIALRHGFAVVPRPIAEFRIDDTSYSGSNVRNTSAQEIVCARILTTLNDLGFADVRDELLRHPSPFAPFVRHIIPAAVRTSQGAMLLALARWWLWELLLGRRPGPWRKLAKKVGFFHPPKVPGQ